jgi:hypothetical protein
MPERPILSLAGVESSSKSVEIVLGRPASDSAGEAKALLGMVQGFVAAGAVGGYSDPKVDAALSTMSLTTGPKPVLHSLSFTVQVAQVDPRAYQILRNMAVKLLERGVRVDEILVRDVGRAQSARTEAPLPTEDNEDSVYPSVTLKPPFEAVIGTVPLSRSRRCLAEFRQSLTPEHVRAAAAAARPWMELVKAGGFCLPLVDPEDAECIPGVTVQFDDVTVEISMARFQASEAAWNVLLNILSAAAGKLPPYEKVMVE